MFDNCLTSQCTGESLKVLTKIKTKGFCKCLTSDSPQPPSPKCIHWTGESLKPATSDNNCASNPDTSSPIFLFANLQIKLFHWLQWGCMGSQSNTPVFAKIAIWQICLFSFLNFFPFCAAAADSVDYFFLLIFFVYCLASADYRWELKPALSYQQSRLQSRLIQIFRFLFPIFFVPGTFTGG